MKDYTQISGEIWKIFKMYAENIPMTEEAWGACLDAFDAVVNKHDEKHEYALRYAVCCIEELERLYKAATAQKEADKA